MEPLRLPCGQLVDRSRQVAELLANTFASVFVDMQIHLLLFLLIIDNDNVRPVPYQVYGGRMHDLNITVQKVYAALQCLNVSSAVTPDNLNPILQNSRDTNILQPF